MRNFTLTLVATLAFAVFGTQAIFSQALPPISFNTKQLANTQFGDNPTSLQFGPDGRLYVAEQQGKIAVFTIERDDAAPGLGTYTIVNKEVINEPKNIPNHNDDGAANATLNRQVTGLLVAGTAAVPIIYVTSSDWRIGGGASGTDLNLDTNSGVISRLTKTPNGWDKVDLVRGLPRCEENHATNGLALSGSTLLVQSGGHTNKGAPSNNFSGTPEYMLSGVLLRVDLAQLESMTVYTDPRSGTKYVYDLPTLNDPTRADINNTSPSFPYPSGHPLYNATIDVGDPFGGNNSLNQAIPEPGGPVQIFSHGFRNAYDVVITESGHIFSSDNGPNSGWGGQPLIYTSNGTLKGVQGENGVTFDPVNGDYITNEFNESSSGTHGDPLHYVGTVSDGDGTYYAGHPAPIQAFPSKAQLIVYQEVSDGNWSEIQRHNFADLLNNVSGYFTPGGISISNFPDRPEEGAYTSNSINAPGLNIIDIVSSSTNGITEYTASNFASQMQGNILTASFSGTINSYKLAPSLTSYETKVSLLSGFGSQPLDVIAQGDDDIFPGTIWVAVFGTSSIAVFEPSDFGSCLQPGEVGYDGTADYDGDAFTNDNEIAVGSNHCSAGSVPADFDGDLIPDGLDDDDDNDGILDVNDAFAQDPQNGTTTNLPIDYPFWNNDPGTGLFGLGFTGLMNNGTTDYLTQFDLDNLSPGGAAGKLGIDAVSAGDALSNSQQNAFQFGVNVDANSNPFTVRSAIESPFFLVNGNATTPVDFQSQGIYIGTGDQDNYLRVVFQTGTSSSDNVYGMEVLLEDNGAVTSTTFDVVGIENASAVQIYISVDPAAGTAQPSISLNGGVNVIILGGPVTLPSSFLAPNDNRGLAVGVIATSAGPGAEFSASWDYITISEDQPGTLAANPTPLDFGSFTENAPASEITLQLTNLGSPSSGNISISALEFVGTNGSSFSTAATPPLAIVPGNEFLLPVIFTPGAVLGAKSATLRIIHDGSNSPLEVPLTAVVVGNNVPLVRINAGDLAVTATDAGPNWEANNTLTAGESYTLITDANKISTHNMPLPPGGVHSSIPDYIDNATYLALFAKERWDQSTAPEMQFQIPLPNEDYTVNLYMGNGFGGTAAAGARVFDIRIEGILVEDNLDLSGTYGHQVGVMLQYPVTVNDGVLNIEFLHTGSNNPIINAIEIIGPPITGGPIVVNAIPDQTNQVGNVIDLAVAASGGDPQQNFTYSITGQPAGLDIESTNGHIFGTIAAAALTGGTNQDGVHNVQVTVSKPGETPVTVSFQWTVTTVPQGWMDQTDDENYTARHECSFVQAGNKFYLFGGRENATTLDVYNTATKTWSPITGSAPKEFNHFQAVEYQGLIWVIGAFQDNISLNETPADHIWAYDPANNEWIQGPEIPAGRKRGSTGLVMYNDKFYIVGGNTLGHSGGYVDWFDEYDPATGQWVPLTDAPRARDHFHSALIGNKLYVAGGRLSGGPGGTFEPLIAEVDVYDFSAGTWSTLPSSQNLPTPRAAAATANFQGELYLIGGEIKNDLGGNLVDDAVKTTESYDPATGVWTTHGNLITERHGTQAIVSGDGIHVAAGSNTIGGSGAMKSMEYFGVDNPQGSASVAGTFQAPTSVQVPIGGSATIALGNTGGNVAILLGEMVLGGTDMAEFSVGANPVGIIPTGSTHNVTVSFSGTVAGKTATLTVNYGAANSVVINLISSNEPTVLYRVNAGGPLQLDTETDWSEDQANATTGQSGGTAGDGTPSPYVNYEVIDQTFGGNTAGFVNNTGYPDVLFHTERYSNVANPNNLQWDFPIANGYYEINLLFAERWAGAIDPGIRVFGLQIEGVAVLSNFDQTAAYGWNTAGIATFHVNVTDGNLDIDFIKNLQNPNIKGIEVLALSGPVVNTPPIVTNPGDQTNAEGDVVNVPIVATEPEIDQTLSYAATGLPPGLTIEPNTGVISGTVAVGAAAASPYAVALTVTDNGNPVESTTINFQWSISGAGATLTLNVTLQGRDADHSGGCTVDFYLTSNLGVPAYSFNPTADAAGNMTLPQPVAAGDYQVIVKRPGYLQHIVAMTVTSNAYEALGMLLAGDISGDNLVDISDFSILASAFLTVTGNAGYEPLADYNGDGIIDISDFSILAQNFLQQGDILPTN